jgi:hypothetical protein
LYRSHGEHKKVLSALSEERCVGSGAVWSRDSYYQWVAEYLQWLWFQDDSTLPSLILPTLKTVMEYNATLGLSILIHGGGKKYPANGLGGKGVPVEDVIAFLESLTLVGTQQQSMITLPTSSVLPPTATFRIKNGLIISLIYLEWLVGSNQSSQEILDLYAQSLMKAIPMNLLVSPSSSTRSGGGGAAVPMDHAKNNLTVTENDSEEVQFYKLCREKLQVYLQSSFPYRVDRLMKYLPKELLHEYALLLSRLGRHEEVCS